MAQNDVKQLRSGQPCNVQGLWRPRVFGKMATTTAAILSDQWPFGIQGC